jgi:rod shape-determining protein MreD
MRWFGFALVAVTAVTLQTTVAPRLVIGGAFPDWILVVVVFFAMHVRSMDVVLAGWVLGLLADFQTAERFGIMSLSCGLVALLVYYTRDHVFRAHPLAHFAMTAVGETIVQLVLLTYFLIAGGQGALSVGSHMATALGVVLYTALFAPPLHAFLLRYGQPLGLNLPRYTHRGTLRFGL